jgi:hypothetical protein
MTGLESSAEPEAHREEAVRKWLEPGVRIYNGGYAGSGTICYYDKESNLAWIISCAHLFNSPNENKVTLEVFYKNNEKLDAPQKFTGDVVAVKIGGYENDISIITFTPDWEPNYFPISPVTYEYVKDTVLYSVGCDSASEVACYFVKVERIDKAFLVTRENSPRKGRSGGGLITEDGWYVGICVRTSDVSGNGVGFFVYLENIHKFCRENNLEWLCGVNKKDTNSLLKIIPIVDRLSPQGVYPPDYIPVP